MFLDTPRWFGFPAQYYVRSKESLLKIFETVNGTRPCFISVLVYPEPNKYIFDRIFFDLDTTGSLSGPYEDVEKLMTFCDKIDVPYTIVFSGAKGFHFYIHLKPSVITSTLLYAAHEQLVKQLQLKHVDRHIYGDIRRVARFPTSKYVNKKGKQNGNYCRCLTKEEFEKGLHTIRQLAKTPGRFQALPSATMTFDEFTRYIDGYTEATFLNGEEENEIDVEIDQTAETVDSIDMIVPNCLRENIVNPNPKHIMRYESVKWLKLLGYTNVAIYNFFESLKWKDWDRKLTRYMVRRIKSSAPYCNKIKHFIGDELCVDCALRFRRVDK